MRFWTALQYPLCQAALVIDGKIVKRIPAHPPQTPARRVGLVSEFDDRLVIGRRNSLELWDRDGERLIQSVYHPWIYSLHACLQVERQLLLACATLDVVFTLDWEGRSSWSWWAWRDGLAAEPVFVQRDDWEVMQITQEIEHDTAHLNSIRVRNGSTVLATLLKRKLVVEVDVNDPLPTSRQVRRFDLPDVHDYQLSRGREVYGTRHALVIGDAFHEGFLFVKRIVPLPGDRYLFSHEQGVTSIDTEGNRILDWTLPRPFGFACLKSVDGPQVRPAL